jgi:hypothetical protein
LFLFSKRRGRGRPFEVENWRIFSQLSK